MSGADCDLFPKLVMSDSASIFDTMVSGLQYIAKSLRTRRKDFLQFAVIDYAQQHSNRLAVSGHNNGPLGGLLSGTGPTGFSCLPRMR